MRELFDTYDNEYLEFGHVEGARRLAERPDLCAFLLLQKLAPGTRDIVSDAQHDLIFLSVDPQDVFKAATEEDILTLIRCGVMYDDQYDSFSMFT